MNVFNTGVGRVKTAEVPRQLTIDEVSKKVTAFLKKPKGTVSEAEAEELFQDIQNLKDSVPPLTHQEKLHRLSMHQGVMGRAAEAGMNPQAIMNRPLTTAVGAAGALAGGAGGGRIPKVSAAPSKLPTTTSGGSAPQKPKNGTVVQSKGKKNVETGKCAEWLAKRDYDDKGFETMQFQNASNQGTDLIARDKITGALTHVEVKGTVTNNAPALTGKGKLGGEKFMEHAKTLMANGTAADKALLDKLISWEDAAKAKGQKTPTYNKREVYIDDKGNGCMERAPEDMPKDKKTGEPLSAQGDKEWKATKTRKKK